MFYINGYTDIQAQNQSKKGAHIKEGVEVFRLYNPYCQIQTCRELVSPK